MVMAIMVMTAIILAMTASVMVMIMFRTITMDIVYMMILLTNSLSDHVPTAILICRFYVPFSSMSSARIPLMKG